MQDLLRAIGMYQDSVQQAATTNAINEASQFANEINKNITDEAQKRNVLQDMGNQLAMRLVGTGAQASHIQQAFNAVNPQQFGSVEQMQLEGALSGNKFYQQQADSILKERERKAKAMKEWESDLEIKKEKTKGEMAYNRELLKQMMKNKTMLPGYEISPTAQMTEKDVEELKNASTNYTTLMKDLTQLDKLVDESGTEAFYIPGMKGETRKLMEQSRTSMELTLKEMEKLGALAGPDVEVLSKALPDPTTARTSIYKAQSEQFKQILKNRIESRAASRGARFTGAGLDLPGGSSGDWKVKNVNGKNIQYRELPNGMIEVK